MKNIFLLPTEESSRIGRFVDTQKLILRSEKDIPRGENVNIYITSEEEVNIISEYVIVSCSEEEIEEVRIVTGYYNEQFLFDDKSQIHIDYCKKIILTTDQKLIADGIQAIDDEFLEWFVKNPTCEYVEVNKKLVEFPLTFKMMYKIIIPQKESKPLDNLEERFKRDMSMIVIPLDNKNIPEEEGNMITDWLDKHGDPKIEKQVEQEAKIMMEKETLEEVAKHNYPVGDVWSDEQAVIRRLAFKNGANYQAERMYSEDEVIAIVEKSRETGLTAEFLLLTEQFKKK